MNYKISLPPDNLGQTTVLKLAMGDVVVLKEQTGFTASDVLKSLFYGKPMKQSQLYISQKLVIPYHEVEKQRVAYMPAHSFTMPDLTVLENVQLWFTNHGDQDAILYEPLLQPIIHTKAGKISGGERRFLESLLMLQLPHKLLLLDQPLQSLAPLSVERVIEKLNSVKPHKAIVINDHYLSLNGHDILNRTQSPTT